MLSYLNLIAYKRQEKSEHITGAIRSFILQDRQYNGLKKKDKKTNNVSQNATLKTIY
jgi:hypothetical protein